MRRIMRIMSIDDARDEDRRIVKMRESGMTYKQIAEALNCALGTVSSALYKHRHPRTFNTTPEAITRWWYARGVL